MPEFIAAVMPITRSSRWHSRTSASPNTCVYCGGAGLAPRRLGGGRRRHALGDRLRLRGVPLLHALEAALLGGREALALDGGDVDDDGALGLERLAQRGAHRADVVAVDDADVGPVELLPQQARRGSALIDSLSCGPRRSKRAPMPAGSLVSFSSTPSRARHILGSRRTRLK